MASREEGRGYPGEPGGPGEVGTRGGGRGGIGGRGGEGGRAGSPRFNRALIISGIIVLAVISTLLLLIQEQIQTTRKGIAQEAQLAERFEDRQQQLILEIRAQSRLNACLTLKLAKRHDVDVSGLDSPACKIFPNGAVVFPGSGSLLDSTETQPEAPGQSPDTPGQPGQPGKPGGNGKESPGPQPPMPPEPPGPPDPPGPPGPTPEPTVTCIPVPGPLPDFCLPE